MGTTEPKTEVDVEARSLAASIAHCTGNALGAKTTNKHVEEILWALSLDPDLRLAFEAAIQRRVETQREAAALLGLA